MIGWPGRPPGNSHGEVTGDPVPVWVRPVRISSVRMTPSGFLRPKTSGQQEHDVGMLRVWGAPGPVTGRRVTCSRPEQPLACSTDSAFDGIPS